MFLSIIIRLVLILISLLLIFRRTSSKFTSWIFNSEHVRNTKNTKNIILKLVGYLIISIVFIEYFRYFFIHYFMVLKLKF